MDHRALVTDIAQRLKLLTADGSLNKVDSLGMIDFVLELEQALKISIPSAALSEGEFVSIDSIVALVGRFSA